MYIYMNTIKTVRMRLVSFIIMLATLLTVFPQMALPIFSDETNIDDAVSVIITRNGYEISELTIKEDDKVTITAKIQNADHMQIQWQIRDMNKEDRWINIKGAGYKNISVSYALVGSMLNESGKADLRCVLIDGDVKYESAPVEVKVRYSVEDDVDELPTISHAQVQMVKDNTDNIEGDLNTYSIVIQYLFDNNAIAFEPYGASVAAGSDFKATITSPKVVGYAPFMRLNDQYVEANEVVLDYKNIQSDITIRVIYEPALVDFSIHHHLQNLLDDDYSLSYDYMTQSKAITGTTTPMNIELDLPGFRSLAYESLTVAADGSTVVEIRYDRNYYLIDFNMAGGYGVEPVYTRYGATVGANVPIRHGYVFGGWELVSYGGNTPTSEQASLYDINNGATITVPDANLYYRAIWIVQETEYTMVFWKENADDDGYSYWGYLDGIPAMSGSYVSAADRISEVSGIDDEQYFTFNSEKSDSHVMVEGDGTTVVNVYYTRNYYTITVKATGKCTIPVSHTHGDACYDIVCGKGHTHTQSCVPELECKLPEHTFHTDSCVNCGMAAHSHGSDCCGLSEHTHTKNCWNGVGNSVNKPTNAPSSPKEGQVYRYRKSYNSYTYYIYIKGTWYIYTAGGASNGDIVLPKCGYSVEHTHGASDCSCNLEVHVHVDSCYKDILHTHIDACYKYSCGETGHTHSTACKRLKCGIPTGHSHINNTCTSASKTNTVKLITRKYGQSLDTGADNIWPITDDNGKTYNSGERWEPDDSSYYTQVLVHISTMPPDDFTLTLNTQTYETIEMSYYLQVLPGEPYTREYKGNYYTLHTVIKANYNYVTRAEDFFDIKGFYQFEADPGFNNEGKIDDELKINFYYNRIVEHYLKFNNNGNVMTDKTVGYISYGALVNSYNFVPSYPNNLEPNAYEFAGWYTSPGCFDGTEVDWDSLTMPEGDLMLYAKWAPIKHTVNIYTDATLSVQIGQSQLVDHNAFAYEPSTHPTNGNYIFQGWFYTDVVNGETVEKAFVFTGIPVVKDLNVYAKWSSHVSVSYKINFVLKNTGEPIADPIIGSAIAGHNKTFDAKAGTELYAAYQNGYYPLTNSHTVTMSADGDHEFTFEYVYMPSMPYLVRYVNSATGETVYESKLVSDNNFSVVTETFVRIDKMMPDAYQKRLILTADSEDSDGDGVYDGNVITFYYKADEVHAYYRVVHYIENIASNGYREYRFVEAVGIIGEEYSVEALALSGFVFNGGVTKIDGVIVPTNGLTVKCVLDEDGLLIELYYDRVEVNYSVQYVDIETGNELAATYHGSGIFGEQIVAYAKDLKNIGYTLSSAEDVKALVLSVNESYNVIIFQYSESNVSIKYQIVGPSGCGSLSQYSENTLAISGKLNGSKPTVNDGYRFVGWYTDPSCTTAVNPLWIDANGRLIPQKEDGAVWDLNLVFYAKYESCETDLTIYKNGILSVDANQASLFRIKGVAGTKTEGIDLTVSIIGNNKVTISKLPIGEYTITELTDWSWRYETDMTTQTIVLKTNKAENVLSFNNVRVKDQWLDGNDFKTNLFENSVS